MAQGVDPDVFYDIYRPLPLGPSMAFAMVFAMRKRHAFEGQIQLLTTFMDDFGMQISR